MTPFERAVEAMAKAETFGVLEWPGSFIVYSLRDATVKIVAVKTYGNESKAHDEARRMSNQSRLLAALRILREPSEAMIAAGCLAQQDPTQFAEQKENHLDDGDFARGTWFAMIDALLKEIGDG